MNSAGNTVRYLAVDLGASSGRGVLGTLHGGRLELEELHRFPNGPAKLETGLHWDFPAILGHVEQSIVAASARGGSIDGMGIDTWGVDYGLVNSAGQLEAWPHHYRDPRTARMMEAAFAIVPREQIYARTGVQFMPLNTLYQLVADVKAAEKPLSRARRLLFMPDLLAAALTGIERTEHSIASTSQLFDTGQCTWADDLISSLGIPRSIFPDSAEPGTVLGPMLPAVASRLGVAPVTVISPAGHDTGSAVAAVPADGPSDWAYISSGTWSLVGRELETPLRTPEALAANFTNECGLSRTIRFHKNIGGLWLLQECLRAWAEEGRAISYSQQAKLVEQTPRLRSLIDPDHPSLAEFGGMPERIAALCAAAGEEVPASQGAMIRCVLESLALKYRMVLQTLEKLTGPVRRIFIVGGGVQNHLLCRYTADATGLPVVAGPVEATAAGNVLAQAMAQKRLASLAEVRKVVARSFDLSRYTPAAGAAWDSVYSRFERIVALSPR